MAGRHRSKRNRGSRNAKARRRRRVVGLGSGAGAVLAFGMGPLGTALPARADILDVIVDPIINPVQQAATAVTDVASAIDPTAAMDALAGLDPSVGVAGVDLGSLGLDPSSLAVGAADVAGSSSPADLPGGALLQSLQVSNPHAPVLGDQDGSNSSLADAPSDRHV